VKSINYHLHFIVVGNVFFLAMCQCIGTVVFNKIWRESGRLAKICQIEQNFTQKRTLVVGHITEQKTRSIGNELLMKKK